MLVCWSDGTNDLSTKCLTFQVFLAKDTQNSLFSFLQDFMKKKRILGTSEVDESFVPLAQRASILYCRLTDLRS